LASEEKKHEEHERKKTRSPGREKKGKALAFGRGRGDMGGEKERGCPRLGRKGAGVWHLEPGSKRKKKRGPGSDIRKKGGREKTQAPFGGRICIHNVQAFEEKGR